MQSPYDIGFRCLCLESTEINMILQVSTQPRCGFPTPIVHVVLQEELKLLHSSSGIKSSRRMGSVGFVFQFQRKLISTLTCRGISFDIVSLLSREELNTSKLILVCSIFFPQ